MKTQSKFVVARASGSRFGGRKLRDEAIHSIVARRDGLLTEPVTAALCADRLACNDAVVVRQISLQA